MTQLRVATVRQKKIQPKFNDFDTVFQPFCTYFLENSYVFPAFPATNIPTIHHTGENKTPMLPPETNVNRLRIIYHLM